MVDAVKTLFLILAIFHGPAIAPDGAERHPQDGPDVDLRVRIEASRIEVQAIVNLAFCDEVVGQTRLFEESLDEKEIPELADALLKTFKSKVVLKVDGIEVAPSAKNCTALPFSEDDAEFFPNLGMRAVIKLRITLGYSLKTEPRSVALYWGLYPRNLALADFVDENITVNAEWTAGTDTQIITLTDEEPEYTWHASEKGLTPRFIPQPDVGETGTAKNGMLWALPLGIWLVFALLFRTLGSRKLGIPILLCTLSIAIIVAFFVYQHGSADDSTAPSLNDTEAINLFNVLHANIYRAFDFTAEEEIYDALSRSVEGDLLVQVYDQIYSSLIMQDQGGAVSRIKEVTPVNVKLIPTGDEDRSQFEVEARWRVLGQVYHWGHTHMRTNEHLARMKVRWSGRAWHIATSEVIEQFRVSAQTSEGNR